MDRYTSEVAKAAGIDPAVIIAIITAVMQIIAGCQQPPKPADVIAAGTWRWRFAVHRALRQNGIAPLSADGRAIEQAMTATAVTEDDAKAFLALCV